MTLHVGDVRGAGCQSGDAGTGERNLRGRAEHDRAIRIAARSGLKLKIAAKIDAVDRSYWEREIAPLVDHYPNVEFIGEINEQQKAQFLGEAAALLFPIDWPEPFGLVMIEAMACGTPVVAFRSASVPEVIDDGLTGFIVKDMDEAVAAVARLDTLDRAAIRTTFERRFTVERMARDYLAIYRALPGVPEVPDDSDESLLQEAGLALRAA